MSILLTFKSPEILGDVHLQARGFPSSCHQTLMLALTPLFYHSPIFLAHQVKALALRRFASVNLTPVKLEVPTLQVGQNRILELKKMRTQVRLGSNCRTRRVWRSENWRSCVTEIVKIQTVDTEWNIPITSQNVKRNRGYYMAETKFLFSCWKIFHSFAALTREIFSTREEKFRISKRPCNVLFII